MTVADPLNTVKQCKSESVHDRHFGKGAVRKVPRQGRKAQWKLAHPVRWRPVHNTPSVTNATTPLLPSLPFALRHSARGCCYPVVKVLKASGWEPYNEPCA
eukprot:UN5145